MSIQKSFVVKNGFEVSTDLILANADTRKVGIASTNPQYTLDVAGGIGATDLRVTGVSTFNNLVFEGYLSIGNTTGQQNQVLTSTGVGVTWRTNSNLRTSTTFTATLGQTIFEAAYSIGYVDVYINGVKLTNSEFVGADGNIIVLNDACFGGEIVEIISFEIGYPLTFSGITLQEEGSVVGTGIDAINFAGTAVTAVSTGSGSTIFVNAQLPLTSSSNIVVGIITATEGFVGAANTTPVTIQLVGNELTFSAVGIGSTTLTLF